MAEKYRLVRWNASDRPREANTEPNHAGEVESVPQREVVVLQSPRRNTALWALATIAAVVVIFIAIWMATVSSQLHQMLQGAQQNGNALAKQQGELTRIQAYLSILRSQLNQIAAQMETYFTSIMQAIQHK